MRIPRFSKQGMWLSFVAAIVIVGCSKMDDTYKDFLKGGQIKYVGKADLVSVQPGRNRLMISWPAPSDPKAVKAKIYWNNHTDSLEVPMARTSSGQDTVKVLLSNLDEALYVFEIVTFDKEGNRSVSVEARGAVYGDTYESMLLSRPVDRTELLGDTLTMQWGASSDSTAIGSEVVYKDVNGEQQTLFVPASSLITNITEFVPQTIKHRTLYLPGLSAIDTFYTGYTAIKIKGQPVELSKAGWTATASSFDSRSGSSYRPPSNAIDENTGTLWVNQLVPQEDYPHTITVDMGEVKEDLEGFAFITRSISAARPKLVELLLSEDNTNWESFGDVELANTGSKQLIPLPSVKKARYFRVIAKNAWDNGKNIALTEVGMYTR